MKFRTSIILLVLVGGCTFFGVDGQHNAWKAFHDRCIEPIAQDLPVHTAGLNRRGSNSIAQGLRAAQDPTDSYWGPDDSLWVLQTNKDKNRCILRAGARGKHVYSRAQNWLQTAYDAGSFTPDHHSSDQGILHFENGKTAEIMIQLRDHNDFMKRAVLTLVPQ